MIFCLKCGEAIPDNSKTCPKCGAQIQDKSVEKAVIYASQNSETQSTNITEKKPAVTGFLVWAGMAVLSLAFLAFEYMSVSIDLLYGGSSDSDYTGYGLIKCLQGTAALSGWMVIILIAICIAMIISGVLGYTQKVDNFKGLKGLLIIECISHMIVTIIPYFHMKKVLEVFVSEYSTTRIGIGCYLNIGVSIVNTIVLVSALLPKLKD